MLGDRCAFSLMSFFFFENWVSFEAFITLSPRSPAHGDAGLRLERESAGLPGVPGAMVTRRGLALLPALGSLLRRGAHCFF